MLDHVCRSDKPSAGAGHRASVATAATCCACLEGKSPRSRSSPSRKNIPLSFSDANQSHNSACLTADEGRWPSSRTRGEMRWTLRARLDVRAGAYGEVVWFGRRGAGVKRAIRSAGDGGKRAVLREEHEVSRKAIAQGRPECSRCPVCSCALLFAQIARETAGAASTRSSLRPLISKRGQTKMQTSGAMRREIAKTISIVGWVERSETHHLSAPALMGSLRSTHPTGLHDAERGATKRPSRRARPPAAPGIPGHGTRPPSPRNRPACLDFRQSDFPLVTES